MPINGNHLLTKNKIKRTSQHPDDNIDAILNLNSKIRIVNRLLSFRIFRTESFFSVEAWASTLEEPPAFTTRVIELQFQALTFCLFAFF